MPQISGAEARRLAALKTNNDHIRKASGEVNDPRALVTFLYLLARDHQPIGVVEELAVNVLAHPGLTEFTNGWLATWAQDLADRLTCPQIDEGAARGEG